MLPHPSTRWGSEKPGPEHTSPYLCWLLGTWLHLPFQRRSEVMNLNISWLQKGIVRNYTMCTTKIIRHYWHYGSNREHKLLKQKELSRCHTTQSKSSIQTSKEQDKQRTGWTVWTLKTRKNTREESIRGGKKPRKLHTVGTLKHRPGNEKHWHTLRWDSLKALICSVASSSLVLSPNLSYPWSTQRKTLWTLKICKSVLHYQWIYKHSSLLATYTSLKKL